VDKIENNPILTEQQKRLLKHFTGWPYASAFYLTGGTALSAFYLQHRLSEDLDFFTGDDVETELLLTFLRSIPEVQELDLERKFDRKIFLIRYLNGEKLRTEFTKYPFKTIDPFKNVEGTHVDSMIDILANKMMALTDRRDVKDYVDIYSILKECPELSINEMITKTEGKFGVKGLKYILQGRFLECPQSIEALNMKKTFEAKEMAGFFKEEARGLIKRTIENEKQLDDY
jgi:predicted nucleotidyltransferase component of viral defense system